MKFRTWLVRCELAANGVLTYENMAKFGTVFTHFSSPTENTHYAVGLMGLDTRIKELEVNFIPVEQDRARSFMTEHGVEMHRLQRILDIPFTTFDPIWFAATEDAEDSVVLIEGTHRYVAAAVQGYQNNSTSLISAIKIPKVIWSEYVIEDFPLNDDPEILKKSFSGIL